MRNADYQKRGFLPAAFHLAHDVAFMNHDAMLHLLAGGERVGSYGYELTFRDDADRVSFEASPDLFSWLANTNRSDERAQLLRNIVFPALLSDFLHFTYEALTCSRKANLIVCYALIRKPLQESLALVEAVAANVHFFAEHLVNDPLALRASKAGGIEAHAKRICGVLASMPDGAHFDAGFLADLRYNKRAPDGFDGICNQAMHLFTEHEAIRTEAINVNFIFSGEDQRLSQWSHLYSRLPYLLYYARSVIESLFASFDKTTDPLYLADIDRRLGAGMILWAESLPEEWSHPAIERLAHSCQARIVEQARSQNFRAPSRRDLERMRKTGAWPGEPKADVLARAIRYAFGSSVVGGKRNRRVRNDD
jgi:hypothetical protein